MRASQIDSSASPAARTFDPTEYALRRREQIERARELRAARSSMMGTGVSRMDTGPKLTRSLSSDNVAGSFAQHASRSCADSRRNSLGLSSSSGPLAARTIDGHGGTIPRTTSSSSTVSSMNISLNRAASCAVGRASTTTTSRGHSTSTAPAGSSSTPASTGKSDGRQGNGRQQKQRRPPNERQRPVEIRQTLKLDEVSLFSEEELAAFRCAGMAAESEAAIGVGLPAESPVESTALVAEAAPPAVVEIIDDETGVNRTPPRHARARRTVPPEATQAAMQHDGAEAGGVESEEKDRAQMAGERGKEQLQMSFHGEDSAGFAHSTRKDEKRRGVSSHKDQPELLLDPLATSAAAAAAAAAALNGSGIVEERKAMDEAIARKRNVAGGGGLAAEQGPQSGVAATTPRSAGKKGVRLLRTLSASVSLLKRAFMGGASFSSSSSSAAAAAAAVAATASNAASDGNHGAENRATAKTSGTLATSTAISVTICRTSGTTGTSDGAGCGGAASASGTPNLVTPTRTLHTIVTPSAASDPAPSNPAPSPLAADVTPRALFHPPTATATTGSFAVISASLVPASASTAHSTPQYRLSHTAQGATSASVSAFPHSGAFVPAPWDPYGASSVPASPVVSEGAGGGGQSRRQRWASIGGGQGGGSFIVLGGMSVDRAGGRVRGESGEGADERFAGYGMKRKEEAEAAAHKGMGYTSDDPEQSSRRPDRQGRATWSATPGDATPMEIRRLIKAEAGKVKSSGVGRSKSKSTSKGRADRVHPEPQTTPAGAAAAAVAAAGLGRSPGKGTVGRGDGGAGGRGGGEDVADDVAAAVRAWARQRRESLSGCGKGEKGEGDVRRQEQMVGVERWLQQRLVDGYSGGSEGTKSAAWELRSGGFGEATGGNAGAAGAGASGGRRQRSGGGGEGMRGTGGRKEPAEGRARWEVMDGGVQEGESGKKVRKEGLGGCDGSGTIKKKAAATGNGHVKKSSGAGVSGGGEAAASGEAVKGKKRCGGGSGGGVKAGDADENSDKENGASKAKAKGTGKGKQKPRGVRAGLSGEEEGMDGVSGDGIVVLERLGVDSNEKDIEKRKKKVVKKTSVGGADAGEDRAAEVTGGAKCRSKVKKGSTAPGMKSGGGGAVDGCVCDGEGTDGVKVKKVTKKKRPVGSISSSENQDLLLSLPDHTSVAKETVDYSSLVASN
ncbi:hypothetical protein CLOM_g16951 [Closterium sp. NIES-68]|nr:hypothetical protein CLOM_g16951 [Closterium sp. NIES-68]GJP85330.1 hypothetical protein CLOP_g15437 [Closterium sp. NIES-67]